MIKDLFSIKLAIFSKVFNKREKSSVNGINKLYGLSKILTSESTNLIIICESL